MQKRLLFGQKQLEITISRLSQQLSENHADFSNSVIIGLQPRGKYFAKRIHMRIENMFEICLPFGVLDVTFYRDDFRRRVKPLAASNTDIPFIIEGKQVVLVDDVLFTGRTINAAMNALSDFGRPKNVELLTLVNRRYSRHLPIEPDYVGQVVNTIQSQHVKVEWTEQGSKEDSIWLIEE